MQQQRGHICATGALSHEESHALNLIGTLDIKTAMSSSPKIARSTPDPFPRVKVGSGNETITYQALVYLNDPQLIIYFEGHAKYSGQ